MDNEKTKCNWTHSGASRFYVCNVCKTRQLTDAERECNGPPEPIKRPCCGQSKPKEENK